MHASTCMFLRWQCSLAGRNEGACCSLFDYIRRQRAPPPSREGLPEGM